MSEAKIIKFGRGNMGKKLRVVKKEGEDTLTSDTPLKIEIKRCVEVYDRISVEVLINEEDEVNYNFRKEVGKDKETLLNAIKTEYIKVKNNIKAGQKKEKKGFLGTTTV